MQSAAEAVIRPITSIFILAPTPGVRKQNPGNTLDFPNAPRPPHRPGRKVSLNRKIDSQITHFA